MSDKINPEHYRSHASGIECIQVTEHLNFCLGNAVKYIWRADLKGDGVADLEKAAWYISREIQRRIEGAEKASQYMIRELNRRATSSTTPNVKTSSENFLDPKVTLDGRYVASDGETFDNIEDYDDYVNLREVQF